MKIIAASAALLSIVGAAAAADNFFDHPSIRQAHRSLQQAGVSACTGDVKECDDGSFVKRNPGKCREFLPCPEDLEGLPSDATARELSHIFRPFPGFLSLRGLLQW